MQKNILRGFIVLLMLLIPSTLLAQGSAISVGDTVTGEAVGNDVEYTIDLATGEVIVIDLSSEDFDTLVKVQDANGSELARNDDGGEGFNSLLTFDAPEIGTYTIVVTSFFNNTVGNYTLSVQSDTGGGGESGTGVSAECGTFSGNTGDLQFGETVTETATGNVTYDINLQADQTVIISLSSDDFDTYLELLDTSGASIASDDDSGGNLNSRLIFTARESATYTILVRSFGTAEASGIYTISVTENCASTDGGTIAYGETISLAPDGALQLLITFDGTAGDVINLIVSSSTGEDTTLSLYDSSGTLIVEDDDSGEGLNPALRRFVLPATGTYEIDLRGFSSDAILDPIEITLEETELLEITAEPLEIILDDEVSSDVLFFEAQNNTQYLLVIELDRDLDDSLYIDISQSGESFPSIRFTTSGASSFAAVFTADFTGMMTVELEYFGFRNDANFTIAVEELD
ncbi:MAG: PPC domain-containing protein [Anaerolineae bacterium]|nr:PPC domain-containing protein [Anaerolineae bacterium]